MYEGKKHSFPADSVGSRIYQIRKYFGISQEEFSSSLCVSYRDLKDVERNEAIPSGCMLELIALKYGISRKWIQTGAGEMLEENNESIFSQLANLRCLSPKKGIHISQAISRIQRELNYISNLLPNAATTDKEEPTHEIND